MRNEVFTRHCLPQGEVGGEARHADRHHSARYHQQHPPARPVHHQQGRWESGYTW